MFAMKLKIYQKDAIIQKTSELPLSVMFIERGCVEVYTSFEGNEFVLDRLYPGSIINYRAVLFQDFVYVNYRAKE